MNADTGRLWQRIRIRKGLFAMLLVGLAWYAVFDFLPMTKIYWAFTNMGQVAPSKVRFIGIANFERLLGLTQFRRALGNTFLISFLKIAFEFPLPIMFALLLNEMRNMAVKRTIQTVIYVPHFLSWVVVGAIWYIILAPNDSPNAQFFEWLGMKPVYWWAMDRYIRGLLVATDIWKNAGYGTIVYLATISGIDPGLYEAATIDGAGHWRRAWHITLTGLRPVIVILFILRIGKVLDIFKQVFVLATPIVRTPSDVLMTYAYRTGIQDMQIGYAMAVSLFTAAIGLSLILLTNWLSKLIKEEGVF